MKEDEGLRVEVTDDGSATILVTVMDEHYHSIRGAITESNHIYRDCAFLYKSNELRGEQIRLFEVGFGTGLNAVVTAMCADERHPVHYITIEKYPLKKDIVSQLHYEELVDENLYRAIHDAEWNAPVKITPYFTLEKIRGDYTTVPLPESIDVVYFDAFAPEKQPDMWSQEAFSRLVEVMNRGAVLTTYCAKGEIRRMFGMLGLLVERLPGPVGGKREILRATKCKD